MRCFDKYACAAILLQAGSADGSARESRAGARAGEENEELLVGVKEKEEDERAI